MKNILLLITLLFAALISTYANNLQIKNTVLEAQEPGTKTRNVSFDISWDNSWRNDLPGGGNAEPYNYDAAWIFIKFVKNGGSVTHATLSSDPAKHTAPSGSTITPVTDGKGVFIYRNTNGTGSNNWTNVKLKWSYGTDIVETGNAFLDSIVGIQVFAIEMVYIPQAGFWVGDPNGPAGPFYSFYTYGSNGAYYINSEDAINYGPTNGQLYSLWSSTINTTKVVPATFPKGYKAFYIMKYEGTNKLYADFLNALSNTQQTNRATTVIPDMSSGAWRGGIYKDEIYKSSHPDRVLFDPTTPDILAYLDWSGLRLMSEFEYEKACRGTLLPITFEYAWGSSKINQFSSSFGLNRIASSSLGVYENGTETVDTVNCHFYFNWLYQSNGSTLAGYGPLRAGIFAKANSSRYWAGATYYGVMEMTGNVSEPVVYIMDASGTIINYSPVNGDGTLDNSGASNVSNGISNSNGIRSKGGNWYAGWNLTDNCVASRYYAQSGKWGIRGVRSAP
jgi:formylglycine-generating enzyme required for sulfatase activity